MSEALPEQSGATDGDRSPFTVHRSPETASGEPTRNTSARASTRAIPRSPSRWQTALRNRLESAVSAVRARLKAGLPVARIRAWATPPDLWDEPRPPLSAVWDYARSGDWTHADGGPARAAGTVYAVLVAVPVHAVSYTAAWLAERPSRAASALGLAWLVWQWPALAHLATLVATLAAAPVRWLFGL